MPRHHTRSNRWIGVLCLLALVGLILPRATTAEGNVYYVSPDGSDSNSGTRDAPWATPGFGSRQLRPGDELVILAGRYVLDQFDESILMPPAGRPGAWITIRGEAGARPVLAGRNNLLSAIDLSGASYVRIAHLEITHDDRASGAEAWFRDAVSGVWGSVDHVVLKDLYIHHIDEFGINLRDPQAVEIVNCRISHCGFGAIGGPDAHDGGWRDVTIRGCELLHSGHYYRGGDGSDRPYSRPDGFGIEPSAGPVTIQDTTAAHNAGDGLDSKAAQTTIRRCVVANNTCDGIKLWDGPARVENTLVYGRGDGDPTRTPWAAVVIGTTHANARFEFVNTTVDDALGGNYLMYAQYDTPDVPIDLVLRNTIWHSTGPNCPIFVAGASSISVENALFYMPQSSDVLIHGARHYAAGDIPDLGAGARYGDPRLVAPAWGAPGDYRLRSHSPARDAGSATWAPATDLVGAARDALPDLGAYEYGTATETLDLRQGWNAISLPLAPNCAAVDDVLNSIAGRYDVVQREDSWTGRWLWYMPDQPSAGALNTIDPRHPLWIHMRQNAAVQVTGSPLVSRNQYLRPGWNMLSCFLHRPLPPQEALASIEGRYALVFARSLGADGTWQSYDPTRPAWANTLRQVEPGQVCWIYATALAELVLPPPR
jgi:hypothetical protein